MESIGESIDELQKVGQYFLLLTPLFQFLFTSKFYFIRQLNLFKHLYLLPLDNDRIIAYNFSLI